MEIFRNLGFDANHVGPKPKHPDVYVSSPQNFAGIIDNKAYAIYSISNDHKNRMLNNYIPTFRKEPVPLKFLMYIAGGLMPNISLQIKDICNQASTTSSNVIGGSAIRATDVIRLLKKFQKNPIDHNKLFKLFTKGHIISNKEIDDL